MPYTRQFSHADDGLARAHRALRSSEQDPFQVKIRTASDTFDIKVQKQVNTGNRELNRCVMNLSSIFLNLYFPFKLLRLVLLKPLR